MLFSCVSADVVGGDVDNGGVDNINDTLHITQSVT
jgi:hypothetical protein